MKMILIFEYIIIIMIKQ